MLLITKSLPPCPGRTLIVGDVHGCREELEILIDAFGPRQGDRIISTGDLINRGPDSPGVLDLARHHGIEPVLGNHEIRLLKAWESGQAECLKARDRRTLGELKEADWRWIRTWPHVLELHQARSLVVHGGFLPDQPWRGQPPGVVTRIQVLDRMGLPAKRSNAPAGRPWAADWKGPEHVFYGHTPRPHPLTHPFATGLDTGCVYGYTLSGIILPDREVYRVHARRAYVED